MNDSLKVTVNGLACTAYPVGGGLYAATPDSLGDFLAALFNGKLFTGEMDVQFGDTPKAQAAPRSTPTPANESITAYRHRTGLSRTQLADRLNVSRRTLGRWEANGRRMSEV